MGYAGGVEVESAGGSPSMVADSALNDLIGATYEAAIEPAVWPNLLARIAESFDARDAALYHAAPGEERLTSAVCGRLPDAVNDEYLRRYAHRDKQILRLLRGSKLRPVTGSDLLGEDDARRCPVHNEFLIPHGIDKQIVWYLPSRDGDKRTLALMREERFGPFEERSVATFGVLAAHVQRSLDLGAHVQTLEARLTALDAALARLRAGLMLLDETGSPVFVNNAAATHLAEDGALRLGAFGLKARRTRDAETLDKLIQRGLLGCAGRRVFASVRQSSVRLDVIPIDPAPSSAAMRTGRHALMVLVQDDEDSAAVSLALVQGHLGVSPAESQLALFLASGGSLRDFATARGVSLHTVRNQLKSIYAKTDLHSQKDVVAAVCALR